MERGSVRKLKLCTYSLDLRSRTRWTYNSIDRYCSHPVRPFADASRAVHIASFLDDLVRKGGESRAATLAEKGRGSNVIFD